MLDMLPQMLLASNGNYYTIIGFSAIIILSYWFNLLSAKTNVPAVLMLIVLGVTIKGILGYFGTEFDVTDDTLSIIGTVGLIMIVLEASLDLELKREKMPLIVKSFMVALVALVLSALLCGGIIWIFGVDDYFTALVYAVPLSIMSSAIIIPSVGGLREDKKEFMVYESTFSDILGIMFFFFLIGNEDASGAGQVIGNVFINILVTIVLAVVASYVLVIVFQRITSHIKLFLLIAVLLMVYSVGKLFHLSSLVIILVFGLVLKNRSVFFFGRLRRWIDEVKMKPILHDFHTLTLESAFVVRSFFFVFFGISINLTELVENPMSAVIAIVITGALFGVRWVTLRLFVGKDILPQLFIAPRGLITILLFFSIPHSYTRNHPFESSILLYTILFTAIIMTWILIKNGKGLQHVDPEFEDRLQAAAGREVFLIPKGKADGSTVEDPDETGYEPYEEEPEDEVPPTDPTPESAGEPVVDFPAPDAPESTEHTDDESSEKPEDSVETTEPEEPKDRH
jgi:cell volume regulation protein A